MAAVIEVENLSKSYKQKKKNAFEDKVALQQLNLKIEEGEIFGFLGPNGAGKTTTIKLLLGFIHPDQGNIALLGEPAGSVSARQKVGYLPEISYYYKFLKVGELLDAYARLFHIDTATRKKKIQYLLEKLGLAGHEKTYLKEFSKGMLQRFSLAQALINDPKLLLLDEPTSGLDPIGRREIREMILELNKQGVTIFFSSHELSAVELISNRVGILNKGQLVREGRLKDLLPPTRKVAVQTIQKLSVADENTLRQKIQSSLSKEMNTILSISTDDHQTVIHLENRDYLYPVLHILEQENIQVESVNQVRETLEDLFMKSVKA